MSDFNEKGGHTRHLEILKRSRHKPMAGDIFYYKIQKGNYYYGRIISTSACQMSIEGLLLVYFYSSSSGQFDHPPALLNEDLLIPPVMTNLQGWYKGYFVHLFNKPLSHEDVLPIHCFESMTFHRYYNEHNQILPRRYEPCGIYGVASYSVIDLEISRALGLE